MQKVVYSVIKPGRTENKWTGVGYIDETDLVIACTSKNGNAYIRRFEDAVKKCHPVIGREDEFKGTLYEIHEVEFETKSGNKDTREIEVEYYVWYKLTD